MSAVTRSEWPRALAAGLLVLAWLGAAGPAGRAQDSTSTNLSLVYSEDFSTYSAKDFTENTDWDIYRHDLRLAPVDASLQKAPAVAAGPGGLVVVWLHQPAEVGALWELYAQKMDANGNRLWPEDRRVNAHQGLAFPSNPAIAVDAAGYARIVWADERSGTKATYAQKLDPDGSREWGQDILVSAHAPQPDSLDVGLDGAGNAIVAIGTSQFIYAQKLAPDGTQLWFEDVIVNREPGEHRLELHGANVTVAPSGEAVFVWAKGAVVHSQRIDASGSPLWALDADLGPGNRPDVALDVDGQQFVAWTAALGEEQYGVIAQKLAPDSTPAWSEPVQVSTASQPVSGFPAIAIDPAGELTVSWADAHRGDEDIYAQRLDASGKRLWAEALRVNSDGSGAQQAHPAVALAGDIGAIVVWADERDGPGDIFVQKIHPGGTRMWALDARLNREPGTAAQLQPAIAADPSGNAIIAWTDDRTGSAGIYAQRLDPAGNWQWKEDVRVDLDASGSWKADPDLAAAADGALVVWGDRRNGHTDIYAQKLGSAGNRLWAEDVRVNSDPGQESQADPAAAVDGDGNAIVVWVDHRSGLERDYYIYAQKLDESGNRLWANDVKVSMDRWIDYYSSPLPDVAAASDGNAVVAWMSNYGEVGIHLQRIDPDGNLQWAPQRYLGPGQSPALAPGEHGQFFITWSSGGEIYLQRFSPEGDRIWPQDIIVNSGGRPAEQFSPAIARGAAGGLILAWTDERNLANHDLNRDIYAQRLVEAGNRLWSVDLLVNSDGGSSNQVLPAVCASPDGNALLAWQDGRNGNWDPFTQRIDPLGEKSWPGDVRAFIANTPYLSTGTVQSKPVDSTPHEITQAVLSADVWAYTGSVVFSLSNNDGVDWVPVTPGTALTFTTPGSDLRWRAVLSATPGGLHSPVIASLRIEYGVRVAVHLPLIFPGR